MNIRKRAEEKYKKVKAFHDKFEIPSLEYLAYTKFKDKKWLVFIMFHAIDIGFIIFWLASLYFVAGMGSYCLEQTNIVNQFYGSNITEIIQTNNTSAILDLML